MQTAVPDGRVAAIKKPRRSGVVGVLVVLRDRRAPGLLAPRRGPGAQVLGQVARGPLLAVHGGTHLLEAQARLAQAPDPGERER